MALVLMLPQGVAFICRRWDRGDRKNAYQTCLCWFTITTAGSFEFEERLKLSPSIE